MNGQDIIVANARQEQYRAEAATRRLVASMPTSSARNPLAALVRIVRASFEDAPATSPVASTSH